MRDLYPRVLWISLALLAQPLAAQQGLGGTGTEVIDDLEIFLAKPGPVKEGVEVSFVVRLDKRPVKTGPEGYRPSTGAPTSWEPEVDFHWNFGDGTGWISTGERPSITHRYKEVGVHTLQVEARSPARTVEGSLPVVVNDHAFYSPSISAIRLDPAESTWELTAEIENPAHDEVEVTWSFPREPDEKGEDLWLVRRTFEPGRHEVQVTWKGDDGSETTSTIKVGRSSELPDFSSLEDFDEKVVTEGVYSGFEGSSHGDLTAQKLRAEVRPFAGNFLGSSGQGQCRFMMTAWDPELLMMVRLIANLPAMPEEGVSFQYDASIVSLTAKPNAEEYLEAYNKSGFNEMVLAALGTARDRARDRGEEPPSESEINSELRDRSAGVQAGEREWQFAGGDLVVVEAPADLSPLVSDEEAYGGIQGTVQLKFVPHNRVVGVLDVLMQGGDHKDKMACLKGRPYKGGICRKLTFKGRFVLDLEAAPRDGLVRYDGCSDPTFAIESIHGPEHGERHVYWRQPRISVAFDRRFDAETLDASTFQLVHRDPVGNWVPVETRIHRDDNSRIFPSQAFLKPVKELWGGVRYRARIKTGEDGVRGLNGGFLKKEDLEDADERLDEDGWYVLREFWTRLDFEAKSGRPDNLSCHVWQGARDAPLIVDKPAVAQVDASWRKNPRVHPDDQLKDLPVREVLLKKRDGDAWIEVAKTDSEHVFKRPDLRDDPDKESKDTANLTFKPDRELPETLLATLVVDREIVPVTEQRYNPSYRTLCSTPVWKHEPKLTIELVQVELQAAEAEMDLQAVSAALELRVPRRFPLATVRAHVGASLDVEPPDLARFATVYIDPLESADPDPVDVLADSGIAALGTVARRNYVRAILQAMQERAEVGDADLVVGLLPDASSVPHTIALGIAQTYPALIVQNWLGDAESTTGSIMHQIGHVLGLKDLPHGGIEAESLTKHVWEGDPLDWHDGFAHALRRGDGWRFYSSEVGDFSNVPLMHPRAEGHRGHVPVRHHYLQAMETLEDSPLSQP